MDLDHLRTLFGLGGRRALVTGGTSGIGAAIAMALGRAGATVTIVGRHEGRLEAAVGVLRETGVAADGISCDLADAHALGGLCSTPAARDADILVAAAGINPRPPMDRQPRTEIDELMRLHVDAPHALAMAAAPGMARRGWGRIITLGSQQSWRAFGNSGAYGVSKAAVGGLTRSLAERWGQHGVTVNCLVPGMIDTPMTTAVFGDPPRAAAMASRTLLGRNGVPADIAGAALFLASPAAAYVTGHMLAVDGGFSVH